MLRNVGVDALLGGSNEVSVQGTNDDAQVSKLSCAKAGYFKDDFIHLFVRKSAKRSPLINRGYFSRHSAVRQLLLGFLDSARAQGRPCQVLSLGAGFDTTWYQLQKDCPEKLPGRYLEVDFKEVTKRKTAVVATQAALRDRLYQASNLPAPGPGTNSGVQAADAGAGPQSGAAAAGTAAGVAASQGSMAPPMAPPPPRPATGGPGSQAGTAGAGAAGPGAAGAGAAEPEARADDGRVVIDVEGGQVVTPHYCNFPVDLRDTAALDAAIERAGLDPTAMTYILSECVMVYMEPRDSSALIAWLAKRFSNAVLVVYEQIKPDDAFGRQMCSNLESRGCPLLGLHATPTLEAHVQRMVSNGWSTASCHDMDTIYKRFLDPAEKARAERLEMFDEYEEWHMMMEHYSITVAKNDAAGVMAGVGFKDQAQQGAPGGAARHLPCAD